jgi:CheY-like chemotaxis protein
MEAIGTLAGGIAHDFNNILFVIMGQTELVLAGLTPESRSAQRLQECLKATRRARDLIKQILAFSREMEQEKSPIHVAPIIKETVKFLRASLPATIEINHRLEPDGAKVLADGTQIHQLLMNLCTNAAHAMRHSGGLLDIILSRITVTTPIPLLEGDIARGRYLRLTVRDSGTGIASEHLPRVFEPYFTTKQRGEGTGLGLAVVHGIVTAHGGGITVASELGKGTEFNVYLPEYLQGAEDELPEPSSTMIGGTERILVVDDEPAVLSICDSMLQKLGYEVDTLTTGTEALKLFEADPLRYDVVLTDMTMPHMTGAVLAQNLLSLRSDLPIILCTGFSESINEEQAKAMGIREFLMKPLLMSELAPAIRRALAIDPDSRDD